MKLKLIFSNAIANFPWTSNRYVPCVGSPYLQGIYRLGIGTKEDEGIKEELNSDGRPSKLDQENVKELRTELKKKDYWTTQEVKIKLLEKFGDCVLFFWQSR